MDFGIKTFLSTTAFAFFFSMTAQAAEVFYVPNFCDPADLKIHVQNTSGEPQRLWAQIRHEADIDEPYFDFAGKESRTIAGNEFLREPLAFSIKTWTPGTLKISAQCAQESSIPLSTLTTPEITHYFPRGVRNVKLSLLNISLVSHQTLLTAYSKTGGIVETKTIDTSKYYDTQAIKWKFSTDVARIEVRGEGRLHSWAFFDNGVTDSFSPALSLKPVTLSPDTEKTYFLVSTRDAKRDESFVVGLSDPDQISTARAQINPTGFEKILVARVQMGNGNNNRNFFSKDKAPYSWSVSQVDAFADFAHISCDGSPDLTEERLMQVMNDGGRICFWRYRVVRELSLAEVSQGKLNP